MTWVRRPRARPGVRTSLLVLARGSVLPSQLCSMPAVTTSGFWHTARSGHTNYGKGSRRPRSWSPTSQNPPALEMTLLSVVLPRLLDCLLHIAAVIDFSLAAELVAGQIREQINVNMIAPMILTRALLPALRRARGLVLIANLTATLSPDAAGRSAYVASKSGVRGFAEILRQEESSHGVRVTTVFPGRTDTPMQERVHEQEKRVYDAARLMRPDTVARSILHVVDLPADATIHDLTIRPTPHHEPAEPPCSGTCRVGATQAPLSRHLPCLL